MCSLWNYHGQVQNTLDVQEVCLSYHQHFDATTDTSSICAERLASQLGRRPTSCLHVWGNCFLQLDGILTRVTAMSVSSQVPARSVRFQVLHPRSTGSCISCSTRRTTEKPSNSLSPQVKSIPIQNSTLVIAQIDTHGLCALHSLAWNSPGQSCYLPPELSSDATGIYSRIPPGAEQYVTERQKRIDHRRGQ